jgi:hypothetical protein
MLMNRLKSCLVPKMVKLILSFGSIIFDKTRGFFWVIYLCLDKRPLKLDPSTKLIISLTSFPARIGNACLTIESLFKQDLRPSKIILVLSKEEFPDKVLPLGIQKQIKRGLEILWISQNMRSFNKLLPARERFPDYTIVTFDDDILYESWRLRKLVESSQERPHAIIGHRGSVVTKDSNGFSRYVTWPNAGPKTPSELCFLTGAGGILYPPYTLRLELLLDFDLALKLCPLADDIWFWVVARNSGAKSHCLGIHHLQPSRSQRHTPALHNLNCAENLNDVQFSAVVSYFQLDIFRNQSKA